MAVADTLKSASELSETLSKEALAKDDIPPHKKIPNGTDLPKGTSIDVAEVPATPTNPRDLYEGKTDLQLEDHHIDDVRSLRVVVVGAGLSGILAAILLPAKVPKIDLVVYEKNADVVSKMSFSCVCLHPAD